MEEQPELLFPEDYCVLCRGHIPRPRGYVVRFEGFEEWQLPVVGGKVFVSPQMDISWHFVNLVLPCYAVTVFCPTKQRAHETQCRVHVIHDNSSSRVFHQNLWQVESAGSKLVDFEICDRGIRCDFCTPEWAIFFAHLDCWEVARRHRPHLSGTDLYRLARLTQPVIPHMCRADRDSLPEIGIPPALSALFRAETSLGRILHTMTFKLPQELRREVLSYLAGTMTFSALSSLHTLALLDVAGPDSSRKSMMLWMPGNAGPSVGKLYAEPISLFGRVYLGRLSAAGRKSSRSIEIPVRPRGVRGVKYVLGTYGICAIAVLYDDGTSSPWLGSPGGGWHARIYGSDLLKLRTLRDVGGSCCCCCFLPPISIPNPLFI